MEMKVELSLKQLHIISNIIENELILFDSHEILSNDRLTELRVALDNLESKMLVNEIENILVK